MSSSNKSVGPQETKSDATPEQLSFTFDQLAVSPLNVRFNEEDCAEVEALAASIVGEGLIQPLSLHPVPRGSAWAKPDERLKALGQTRPAAYGIYAGGRRYRAIVMAIGDGRLPRDFPIAARVRDLTKGEIILASLDENLQRKNLREYEVHRALAAATAEGMSPEEIARHTGQKPEWVARQLRLGELHPDVFAAYIAGEISADQAKAYGATDDRALQAECFAHFARLARYEQSPAAIRGYLKVGDAELKKLLLFVGEAVYRGRGGRFELDLFADGPDSDRGRVVDEALLRELSEEKLAGTRTQIRNTIGERDLRFQALPPQFGGRDDLPLEFDPSSSSEAVGQKGSRKHWKGVRLPTTAPVDAFVATIDIDREGRWEPRFWWASRTVKGEYNRKPAKPEGEVTGTAMRPHEGEALADHTSRYEQGARQIVRDRHGLTADGLNICRSLRRDLLRGLLLAAAASEDENRYFAPRDYLTWSQLRGELTRDRDAITGARGLAGEGYAQGEREPAELLRGQRDGQVAAKLWARALANVAGHPAFALDDPAPAFRTYLAAEHGFKALAEAVLAGLALVRSANTPGYRVPVHDALADVLGATDKGLRELWQPTPAFTGLFGKLKRLELAQPFVERAAFKDWHKLKDKPMSGAVAAALQGLQEGENGVRAKRWIHPLLAFEPQASSSEAVGPEENPDEQRKQDPGPDDESVPDEVMTVMEPQA